MFVKLGHCQWRPFDFSYIRCFMSLGTACGDSVFCCVSVHAYIQTSRNVFVSSSFHCSISLCTACGDSVFCCSGTASSDPCQFFSFHHIISLGGTACADSVFRSVEEFCESLRVFLSLSGPLCASLCFSEALWASLGLSGPLWASLGLSGPLWASLGLSGSLWASLHNENKTLCT